MRKSLVRLGVAVSATALSISAAAVASSPNDDGVVDSGKEIHDVGHHQHGGDGGHLPASQSNVDIVGKLELTTAEGRIADVGVHKGFAYLGAFRQDACGGPENAGPDGGAYIVDIRDPANPVDVGFVPIHQDSYVGEGVQALTVTTPKFNGDMLVLNAESCGKNDKGGFSLYDVSDPRKPVKLVEHFGDFNTNIDNPGRDANDIHSAFVWDAGSKAYVVVVDDFERTDVDIFDITDPRKPVLVGEYDLDAHTPQIVQPDLGTGSSFFHDVVVREFDGRQIMLLSYWDGGYVLLDVTDPAAATYVGDSDFANPDPLLLERTGIEAKPEGNAHQAEFSKDGNYIVAADEDFSPFSLTAANTTDGTQFDVTSGSDTPQLAEGDSVSGQTVFGGRACNGDPAVPAGDGTQVALVERGLCTFTEKVANVEAAGGYVAVIVFNRTGSDGCSDLVNMLVEGGIPAFFASRSSGFDLLNVGGYDEAACRAGGSPPLPAVGTTGDAVEISSSFDGWGYVHLYRNDVDPDDGSNKLEELDTYAIPEAHDPAHASGFGDLSVHEVAMSHVENDLAYFAYYSGGFRVARIENDELVEVGHRIDEGGNNLWGVQVFEHDGRELVAASDRDFGLYIFEYSGP